MRVSWTSPVLSELSSAVVSLKYIAKRLKSLRNLSVSDHPLTHMLRHYYETKPESHRKTVTNILEASVNYCISLRKPFGILTTGAYWQKPLTDATNAVMGDQNNTEFVGVVCSGLGVVDVGSTGENEATLQHSAVELTQKGATVIILGCAGMGISDPLRPLLSLHLGMTGMEKIINTGLYNAGISPVDVVDGTWAGLQMFTDMARKKS